MWNSFLERGKELAEKAKAAAETIDKQIDATVGLDSHGGGNTSVTGDLSAGFKGASSLLFGNRSDPRNSGSGSNVVSGEYLSQRESIGFVAGDDDDDDDGDAWGDDDDIVIPDESTSQVPSQNEEEEVVKKATGAEPLQGASGIDVGATQDVTPDVSNSPPTEQDQLPAQAVASNDHSDAEQQDQLAASEMDGSSDDVPVELISNDLESPSGVLATPAAEANPQSTMQGMGVPNDAAVAPLTSEFDSPAQDDAPWQEERPVRHETGHGGDTVSNEQDTPSDVRHPADQKGWAEESASIYQMEHADANEDGSGDDEEKDNAAPGELTLPKPLEASPSAGSDTTPLSHDPHHDPAAHWAGPIEEASSSIEQPNQNSDDDPIASSPCQHNEATPEVVTKLDESAAATRAARDVAESSAERDESTYSEPDALSRRTTELSPESYRHDGPSASHLQQELDSQREITRLLEQRLDQLTTQLQQREDQLVGKTTQLSVLQSEWDAERLDLQSKLQATKDEAKRRIQKAKERVDAVEAKLRAVSSEDAQQAEVIAALRSEGERLAIKQSEMEKAVRAAKGESRQLREQLEDEAQQKGEALTKIQKLEADLKDTRDNLASARRGESQADKLEIELATAREDLERKGSTLLSLEQELKEKTAEIKELVGELENARAGAAIDNQVQQEKLMKHHEELVKDLESKLRTMERDAAIREDALRHEVDELRKRWQDAVRRADTLSMDIQSSTAPLMRQLESAERQSRIRAAAAAEIETKLRSDLEETVVANEKLTKDCNELQMKLARLDRRAKEADGDLQSTQAALESKTAIVKQLEEKLQKMEADGARLKQEWAEVERLANEGVTRVRSELTQAMVDSEQRHLAQVESLKAELAREREKVEQLEGQITAAVSNAGLTSNRESHPSVVGLREAEPQRLRKSVGQAQILAGALGFDEERDDGDDDIDDVAPDDFLVESAPGDSFAAIEELSSRLKAAKVELLDLKKSLSDSERSRNQLAEELGASRIAKEKLPLFEAKVKELTAENEEQALEIMGLREDIDEVRELYRAQLNMLLEEKARVVKPTPDENGTSATQHDETLDATCETETPGSASGEG